MNWTFIAEVAAGFLFALVFIFTIQPTIQWWLRGIKREIRDYKKIKFKFQHSWTYPRQE